MFDESRTGRGGLRILGSKEVNVTGAWVTQFWHLANLIDVEFDHVHRLKPKSALQTRYWEALFHFFRDFP